MVNGLVGSYFTCGGIKGSIANCVEVPSDNEPAALDGYNFGKQVFAELDLFSVWGVDFDNCVSNLVNVTDEDAVPAQEICDFRMQLKLDSNSCQDPIFMMRVNGQEYI